MPDEKKIHWTQTDAGKAKMAKAQKKSWQTRRKNGTHTKKTKVPSSTRHRHDVVASKEARIQETPTFAYALGHIECWIATYAASAGVPAESLAAELGKVLQLKARG
jgi:hypothetical protein